jgi:hypothetical protein
MTGAQIASTPKLKKSVFSFVKPSETRATLKTESTQLEALVETNRILVEIQKQLSLDFANRIVEKRQELRGYKQRVSRERASKKEQAIESIGKFGSNIVKAFDKVAAPAKGIFQRILDFFSIIVTGLVVNNAFNWISKKENREKLAKFFGFLANHWKELLVVFGTYKLLRLVLKIRKILDLFKRRPPRPPGGGGRGGGGPSGGGGPTGGGCGPVFSCIAGIGGATAELLAQQLKKTRTFRPLFAPPVVRPPTITPPTPTGQPTQQPTQKPQGKPWWQSGLDIVDIAADIATIVAIIALLIPALPGDEPVAIPLIGRLAAKYGIKTGIGRGVTAAAKNPISKKSVGTTSGQFTNTTRIQLTKIAKNNPDDLIQYLNSSDKTARDIARQLWQKSGRELPQGFVLKSTGGTIPGFSLGGTVGGTGPGNVDSVPVKLSPGEEVIRTSAANLFRPLLKDINNNAGRMWLSFSAAVKQLVSSNETMRYSLNELSNNLQLFKQQLDQFVNKEKDKKLKGGQGGGTFIPKEVSPNQAVTNIVMPRSVSRSDLKATRRAPAKMIVPINLPEETIVGNMPAIDGGVATEEPYRDSINMSNPWRKISTEMYGIFV